MYSQEIIQRGFEHLETATRNINAWPAWKKELAGIINKNQNTTESIGNTKVSLNLKAKKEK